VKPKTSVAVIVGTRPEVIKMAPVYFALAKRAEISPILISSGQHREMLDQGLATFGLKPDIDLGVMREGQALSDLTQAILRQMTSVLRERRPAAVLVQGDTTTVLATAIAAFYERIPVGHVEAGLRTHRMDSPWPEEMNRRLTDPICMWCFAPTEVSKANLLRENIPASRVHVTGNSVIDAILWVRAKLQVAETAHARAVRCGVPAALAQRLFGPNADLRMVLVTGHRRESFGPGFENICEALARIVERFPDTAVVYPVHLNPNVRQTVYRRLGGNGRIALVEPMSYEDFVGFMDRSTLILSDSGGVQEEAPSLGKPVLVMRDTTERPEGVEAGTSRLVGTNPDVILDEVGRLLGNPDEYRRRSALANPYGDGHASERIAEIVASGLKDEGGGQSP
jgi:UDP-N-acetylglucosamine 2-epimerase (non-hydrolysing)